MFLSTSAFSQLRYLNTIQQIYFTLAELHFQTENLEKTLCFLHKSERLYAFVSDANVTLPNTCFNSDFKGHLLSQIDRTTVQKAPGTKVFSFYFNGGIDAYKLKCTYVKTRRLLCEVYKRQDDQDKYLMVMIHQLDFSLLHGVFVALAWYEDCCELGANFLETQQFAQAQYLYLCAQHILRGTRNVKIQRDISVKLANIYTQWLLIQVASFASDADADTETEGDKVPKDDA
jgi:hypothetical protein